MNKMIISECVKIRIIQNFIKIKKNEIEKS